MMDTTGPVCHHCGAPAEIQWPRFATDIEAAAHWDALEANILASGNPGYIQDRTSPVHKPVYGCGDHYVPMPCTHHTPVPAPCPVCHAAPGSACTTPDGSERPVEHPARAAAQQPIETCRHAHAADCGGYGACRCPVSDTAAQPKPATRRRTPGAPQP